MSLTDYNRHRITNFRGSMSLLDEGDVGIEYALRARNVRFSPGRVGSREGHREGFVPSSLAGVKPAGVMNWRGQGFSGVIYGRGAATFYRDFTDLETEVPLFNLGEGTRAGISVVGFSDKALLFGFNTDGTGTLGGCVVRQAGQLYAVDMFPAPTNWPLNPSQSANAGVVTTGTHKLTHVIEYAHGFIGKLARPEGESVTVVQGKKISYSWDADFPPVGAMLPGGGTTAYKVRVVMTRADNPHKWYFVPEQNGGVITVAADAAGTINGEIDISDESLIENETDLLANDHQFVLTNDASNNPPFLANMVLPYGERMVYLAGEKAYISDPNRYFNLTEDRNVRMLPGKQQIVTGMVVMGVLYLLGQNWTYALVDNTDKPSTWGAAKEVDGRIGTRAVRGVTVSASKGYGWVADEAGLYYFDGVYSSRPVSFYQEKEWKRINWAAAQAVRVLDDTAKQIVYVAAPLDGATEATHILCWDYHGGRTPEKVDFSLDDIEGFEIRGMAMVEDPTTKRMERWLIPAAPTQAVLIEDAEEVDDGTRAIHSNYRTAPIPPEKLRDAWNVLHGYHLKMRGEGDVRLQVFSQRDKFSQDIGYVTLEEEPEEELFRGLHFLCEHASLDVAADISGHWWELAKLDAYWSKWGTNR